MTSKHLWLTGIALAASAIGVLFIARAVLYDPKAPLLLSNGRAQWITLDQGFEARTQGAGECISAYRKQIVIEKTPPTAVMDVRVMKRMNVLVDGKIVFTAGQNLEDWKRVHTVDLAPFLTAGKHVIAITAYNWTGPTCARAACPAIDLFTGPDWEASRDGQSWTPARIAGRPQPCSVSRVFPRADRVFLSMLPFFVPIFLLVFFLALRKPFDLTPGAARWLLLAAWVLLAINNLPKLPPHLGFDAPDHLKYIQYVADHGRIPLANEGWQTFQSPLFYVLGALLYKVFGLFLSAEVTMKALRILPLLTGIAQIEICYRVARRVYPERKDLQILGLIFGGLLPMNIYMAQYVSNEPMAAFFESLVVLWCVRLLCEKGRASMKSFAVLGCLLGLALLTKVTAIVLAVPTILAVMIVSMRSGKSVASRSFNTRPLLRAAAATSLVLGIAALISGWYYIRNWVLLGHPFIGGWDAARGFVWWQPPGFRTPHDFLSFGEALFYPVYSGLMGFWDGLYSTIWIDGFVCGIANPNYFSPPWNYNFLLSGVWLAILPTAALCVGIGVAISQRKPALLFALGCTLLFGAALTWHYLTNPSYCAVKAFYALGITPCLALLAVGGFDVLTRTRWLRAAIYGGFACWALASYLSYFVI